MLILCSGTSRLLSSQPRRIAFGVRHQYGLLSILVPSHRTKCVSPAMFCLKEAYSGIETEPIAIWCMCSECFRMNLVHHDVNMEMLLVIVRDDHILMVFISECLQCL